MLWISRRLSVRSTYRLCCIAKLKVCDARSLFLQMLDVQYMNKCVYWKCDTLLSDGKMKNTYLLSLILVINESDPWLTKIKIKWNKDIKKWNSDNHFSFFGQFENNLKKKKYRVNKSLTLAWTWQCITRWIEVNHLSRAIFPAKKGVVTGPRPHLVATPTGGATSTPAPPLAHVAIHYKYKFIV